MTQKIIIDTDPGQDDAMALMIACKSPELDILAVTTVCGNSTIENTTRNARFILDFMGRNDIPVYSGVRAPLNRKLIQAVVHGKSGLEGIDPTNESCLTGDASKQLLQIIEENPYEVTIVALGPLTNVAQAIQKDPQTMQKATRIVAMGGAIEVAGNKNRVAEFNIFVDPEAADIVMCFPVLKTLVPLDVCNRIQMQLEDIGRIKDTRLRELLTRMLTPYIFNLRKDAGANGALMFDPLTVFYLLQPEACKTTEMNVLVETRGELTRGMTVAERRNVGDGLPPNVTVLTDINADSFIEHFIRTLDTNTPRSVNNKEHL